MLAIWLEICKRLEIQEVLINIHAHADAVREFVQSRHNGPKVNVVEERELLGSAGTLRENRSWTENEPCFWVFYADVLGTGDFAPMIRLQREREPTATLGVYRVPDPSRCGIVTVGADGIVEKFVEKPLIPDSDLAFSGIMLATPAFMEAIPQGKSDIGYDVLPTLTGRMLAYTMPGYVLDIGTIENYHRAQATWPGL